MASVVVTPVTHFFSQELDLLLCYVIDLGRMLRLDWHGALVYWL
jgi:hypothetical protein